MAMSKKKILNRVMVLSVIGMSLGMNLGLTSQGYCRARVSTKVTTGNDSSYDTASYGPESRRFGAGLYLGEPMGLTAKGYVTRRLAIDGTAGWTFDDEAFLIMSDVTYDIIDLPIHSRDITLPMYVGGGMKLEFGAHDDKDTVFGLRVPIGLAVQWVNHPVEVFAEIAPGVDVAPSAEFDLTGGAGVRFYF